MIYLFLCIISSTLILIVFKLLDRLNVSTVNAIVVNYFTAALLGLAAGVSGSFNPLEQEWFLMSVITGFLFVFMFFVIGYSARVAGITVTSLTTKLSVVIPVIFSIIRFGEEVTAVKITGMLLALAAIVMIVYRPKSAAETRVSIREVFWLPFILFFGAGFIDSLIKYSQELHVPEGDTIAFATSTFIMAALTSSLFRLTVRSGKEENRWYKLAAGGIALGLVNFGSLYFLVMALESGQLESSVVFGINNIGVVLLSVISGMVLFRERTTLLNRAGIMVAIIAILILFYS